MKRRVFIKTITGASAVAITGALLPGFRKTAKNMLSEDTYRLRIKEESIDQFMAEADRECFWDKFSFTKQTFITIQHLFQSINIRLPYHGKYLQYRNMITGHFLYSTNLFFNPPGTIRNIMYMGFYNPYKMACFSPFNTI